MGENRPTVTGASSRSSRSAASESPHFQHPDPAPPVGETPPPMANLAADPVAVIIPPQGPDGWAIRREAAAIHHAVDVGGVERLHCDPALRAVGATWRRLHLTRRDRSRHRPGFQQSYKSNRRVE
jgi:hypothetical protein